LEDLDRELDFSALFGVFLLLMVGSGLALGLGLLEGLFGRKKSENASSSNRAKLKSLSKLRQRALECRMSLESNEVAPLLEAIGRVEASVKAKEKLRLEE